MSAESAVASHIEPLRAIGIAAMERPYPTDLAFLPTPAREFAYTRTPFHHVCDNGVWRPDDRMSGQCARWLTEGGGRMLLTIPSPTAAVELSQGVWMLRGLSLIANAEETAYGMVDRIIQEDVEWWTGFLFACMHFEGVDSWAVNLNSGRVMRAADSTELCLSHLSEDAITDRLQEFFEYKGGDAWLLSVAALSKKGSEAE